MTLTRSIVQSRIAAPSALRVTLFLDGADLGDMERAAQTGVVEGFTTNPTLVAKAGVPDYREFAVQALARVQGAPISFEVLADDLPTIAQQARTIASSRLRFRKSSRVASRPRRRGNRFPRRTSIAS